MLRLELQRLRLSGLWVEIRVNEGTMKVSGMGRVSNQGRGVQLVSVLRIESFNQCRSF